MNTTGKMHLVMSSIYTPEIDDPTTPASTDGPLLRNDIDPDIVMRISPDINDSQNDTLLLNIQRYAAGTFPAAETEAYFNSLSMEELHAALQIITATINNNVMATLVAPTHFDASVPALNSSLFVDLTMQGQSDSASAHIPSFHSMYLEQQALANPSRTSMQGVPTSTSVNGGLSAAKGTLAQRRGQLQRSLSLPNPPTVLNHVRPFPQRHASAPMTCTVISPTPSTTNVATSAFTTEAGTMTASITLPQLFPTYSHFLSQISEILPVSPASNSSAAHVAPGSYVFSGEGSGGDTVVNDLLASQAVFDPGFIEDMSVYFKDGFAESWSFDGVNMNSGGSGMGDVANAPGIGGGRTFGGRSGTILDVTTANRIDRSNAISLTSGKKNARSISSVGPASSAFNFSTSNSSTRRKSLKPLDAAKFSAHKGANSDSPQPPTPVIGECSESVLPMCVRPQSKLPVGVVEKHGRIRTKRESLGGESERGRGSKRFRAMVESPLSDSVVFGEIGGEEGGQTKADQGDRLVSIEGSAQDGTGLGFAGLPSMRTNSSPVILSGPGFYPNPSTNASNAQGSPYYHHAPLIPILQTSYSSSFYPRLPNPYSPVLSQDARTTDEFISVPPCSTPTPRNLGKRQRECSPLFTPRLAQEESGLHAHSHVHSLSQTMLVPSSSSSSSTSALVLDIGADTTVGIDLGDNDHVSPAATNTSKMDVGTSAPPALGVLHTSSSMNTTLSSLAASESMSKRSVSGRGSKDVELVSVQSIKEGISLSTVMEVDETPDAPARMKNGMAVREKREDKENSVARGVAHDGVRV